MPLLGRPKQEHPANMIRETLTHREIWEGALQFENRRVGIMRFVAMKGSIAGDAETGAFPAVVE